MTDGDDPLPYARSEATRMLKAALKREGAERGLSTRAAARELGYKATVVVSQMATGRVPIPLDRAVEIAEVVGLDAGKFYRAVLEQRYPGSAEILSMTSESSLQSGGFAGELALLAGKALDALSHEHKRILREVVAERSPARRWLSLAELPTILALRRLRPRLSEQGLPDDELGGIETFLAHCS